MAAAQRLGSLSPWLLSCLAAACIGIGLLTGVNPEFGLLGALGLMFAVVAIMDLTLGFVLFTVASFLDLASGNGSFSGTKVIGLVLFVSWLARLGTRGGADVRSFVTENPWLTVSLAAMLAWSVLSFAWASSASAALGGAGRYLLVMMLVPIGFGAIRTRKHAVWVAGAFVLGALLSGVYGFIHPTSVTSADVGRLTGTIGDANGEATVLAAAIPLLIGLAGVVRGSARMKLAALVGVAILFAGLVNTLSREGLVSLGAVMVAAVIFGGRWRRKAAVLLVLGATATAGYYAVLAPATALSRVTSTDTSGRSSLWTVAWRVIKAHPVLGVGQDNFILVENRYVNQPGALQAIYLVTAPKLTHNTFLEALADLGIPGLLTLLAVLATSIGAAVRATWIFQRRGDSQMELLSRGVVLALVAVLASDLFVASGIAKYLWIPLAMCPALLWLARHPQAAGELGAGTPPRL